MRTTHTLAPSPDVFASLHPTTPPFPCPIPLPSEQSSSFPLSLFLSTFRTILLLSPRSHPPKLLPNDHLPFPLIPSPKLLPNDHLHFPLITFIPLGPLLSIPSERSPSFPLGPIPFYLPNDQPPFPSAPFLSTFQRSSSFSPWFHVPFYLPFPLARRRREGPCAQHTRTHTGGVCRCFSSR